ncbi:MAG: alpha-hydroxy-acid oxidizing protein [Thermoplasmata archaeon]|nr:alpha-hydroxy-acid oxidizing protein [Thermoplasmata archaeon]
MPSPPGFRALSDLETAAEARLPRAIWDYVAGGSGDERTLAANRAAFLRRALSPHILEDVSRIDPTTRLLGDAVRVPFFIAPTAYQGQVHAEGEPGTAAAASSEGVLHVLSALSTFSLEAVAAASAAGLRWFQLYPQPEPSRTEELVRRAERAGYRAIVLTADVPMLAVRDRQAREGFALDAPVPLGNGPEYVSPSRSPDEEHGTYRLSGSTVAGWEVLDRLRATTRLPIVVKGILRRDDARRAIDHGAGALVVSNHGGRQLDGAPATLDVLAEIVAEVGGDAEVYLDGGVRRGSDVALALAMGARAVGIGRPVLWALAVGGRAGVQRYLALLRAEFVNVMALCGVRSIAEFTPDLIRS